MGAGSYCAEGSCGGASTVEAGRLAGVSNATVWHLVQEHGVVMCTERVPRAGVLTIDDREQIWLGDSCWGV